jgi:hypothetical protein
MDVHEYAAPPEFEHYGTSAKGNYAWPESPPAQRAGSGGGYAVFFLPSSHHVRIGPCPLSSTVSFSSKSKRRLIRSYVDSEIKT